MNRGKRRHTMCESSHLHRFKTERLSLSESNNQEQPKASSRSSYAPQSVQLLQKSAVTELIRSQQHESSIQTLHRSNYHRPTSSSSSVSPHSLSTSRTTSLRRLLHESDEILHQTLVQAEEATADTTYVDNNNARVAALSAASALLRASISSNSTCIVLGCNLDSERHEHKLEQTDVPVICSSAVQAIDGNFIPDNFDINGRLECQICFDKLNAPQTHVCACCGTSFCTICTRWYIEYKVLEGEVSRKKMVCPAPRCTYPLSKELVEALVSPETFDKYKKFLKNQKAGVRFCPRAGCCAILDEPLNSSTRRVKCQICRHESCMRCGGDFHKIPTCRHVEKLFGRWKKRHNVRGCPSCKTVIEKKGGCSHMKCFQCGQEFCWSCLRPWNSHNETLCLPLSFLRSKNRKYGCSTPMRVVTKTSIVSVAAVMAVAAAGLAVAVLPPVLGYQYAKDSYSRRKYARLSYVCVVDEEDVYLR